MAAEKIYAQRHNGKRNTSGTGRKRRQIRLLSGEHRDSADRSQD
ncbi:hypothetical protein [Dickeya poaceiphila]|nr:hypothetical protein [Dickeya poaceiphila]